MPAAYAHIRFGREQALPGKYGALPRNFPQLYTVGLQGPDLLFYHNPVFSTAKVREGHRLHAMTGQTWLIFLAYWATTVWTPGSTPW